MTRLWNAIAHIVVWAVFDIYDRAICRLSHRHP